MRPLAIDEMTRVTSYADVGAVLNGPDARQALHRSDETTSAWGPGPTDAFIGGSVISLHGDEHFNRRRLESKLFTKAARARMEFEIVLPVLRRQLEQHLADAPVGEADLIPFTRLILVRLSGTVVGVPPIEDLAAAERLRLLSEDILNAVAVDWSTGDRHELTRRGLEATGAFEREFYAPARSRVGEAADGATDVISLLVGTPGIVGADDIVFREAVLFLIASSNTTTNALPHAIWALERWLERHPEARGELASFEFCRRVAGEALRLHPPVPGLWRQLTAPLTLPSGAQLQPGEFVFLDLQASAQDTKVFGEDAHVFNPRRELPKGIWPFAFTFGGGPHMCLGRTLAIGDAGSAEGEGAPQGVLTQLLHELYAWGVRLDPDREPKLREATEKQEYVSFPVRFAPARR